MTKSFIDVRPFNRRIECNKIGIFSSVSYMPRFHYHLEYELFYLDKGAGVFGIENSTYNISEGDVVFVEPDVKHFFKKSSEDYHYYAFVFDMSVFGSEQDDTRLLFDEIKIRNQLTFTPEILAKIRYAFSLESEMVFGRELMIKTVLLEIFSYIIESKQYIKYSQKRMMFQPQSRAVQDACNYIQENYRDKIDYDEIIQKSNYSKSQFMKLFKKQTGMNITDYLNKIRIENACLEMIKTNKSITEVATENGFNNIQYFSKKFKEIMNCTPREYKNQGIDIMIPSNSQKESL